MTDLENRYLTAKRSIFDQRYGFLNKEQRNAVFTVNGSLLVLAGAGTGKTTLLVSRIAYILKYGNAYLSNDVPNALTEKSVSDLEAVAEILANTKKVSTKEIDLLLRSFEPSPTERVEADNILAITFTNKAANEMKMRLHKILGDTAKDIWCGTFHSVCLKILRIYGEKIGLAPNFAIYDTGDVKKLIEECIRELDIDEKYVSARGTMSRISMAKNELVTPGEFGNGFHDGFRTSQMKRIYSLYQKKLSALNAVDFDDIIMKTVFLFRKFPFVRQKYQDTFRYILVDEFQDTNAAQFELIKLLSEGHNNLMVVGDDDQSIYKFRGAVIDNILRFGERIEGTQIIKLEENYRSTNNILNAANSVIRHNTGRHGKELRTNKEAGSKIMIKEVSTQNEEASFVIGTIKELVKKEKRKYGDFAIFYRTNAQSSVLETYFSKSGIPYRIVGGMRFYDRKEVKDILAYLNVIDNPSDNLRLERIINEPKRSIGKATMDAVRETAEKAGTSVFNIMENVSQYPNLAKYRKKFNGFVSLIRELQTIAEKDTLSDVVRMTIEQSGYQAMLIEAEVNGEGSERRENVKELISVAMQYEKENKNATLHEFLEEMAVLSDIYGYESEKEAVVLMTIHASKGLEFPVVFLPGMEEGIFPNKNACSVQENLEEERRLAYVAITRAKERVCAIHANSRVLWGDVLYNERSRFLDEIDEAYKECI